MNNLLFIVKSKVFNSAPCLVTQLYAHGSLNKKIVHEIIINICTTYINNYLDFVKCKFQNNIELHNMLDVMKMVLTHLEQNI